MLAMSGSFMVFMVAAYVITSRLGSIPIFNRLALAPPSQEHTGGLSPTESVFAAPLKIGDEGVSDSFLRPAGRARFGEEYYDVVSDGSLVDAGTPVRVVSVAGNVVTVREISG